MVDADVIIRGEKDIFDVHAWFASRADDEFEIAAITLAELWHGVERAAGPNKQRRELFLRSILESLVVVPYTSETALRHAKIWAELMASGKMIGSYDLIVAATALERGSEVATFNRRHFEAASGLKVIEPSL